MIHGRNVFDQLVKNNLIKYDNNLKVTTGQGYDYTTGCLLDYCYSNRYYKLIAIHLRKKQALDVDPKVIQQINFTANLDWDGNTTMFFNTEEVKEIILGFLQRTVKIL